MEAEFREQLRGAMDANGDTQERAAEKMGVSQPAVSDWLLGKAEPVPGGLQRKAAERYIKRAMILDGAE